MREYTQEDREKLAKQQLLNEETKRHFEQLETNFKNNPFTKQEKEEGLKKAKEFEQEKDTIQIKIKELKKEQLKIYNIFFDKATEQEEEDYKKTNATNLFYTIFIDCVNTTKPFFAGITEEIFMQTMKKEIEILQKSIKIKEQLSSYEKNIKDLFFRAENPYFEGMQNTEKEEYFEKISLLFSEIYRINNLFCEIFTIYTFIIEEDLFHEIKNGLEILKEIELQLEQAKNQLPLIENFKPKTSKKAILFLDNLSNNFKDLEKNKENSILLIKANKKRNINKLSMKVFLQNADIETTKPLEEFDKIILEAIYMIAKENTFFDIQMIKEQLLAKKDRHIREIDKQIEESIKKIENTKITFKIEKNEEKRFHKVTKGKMKDSIEVEESILSFRKIRARKGGIEKEFFVLNYKPIYFNYIESINQIKTIDKKLLDIGITAKKENIVLVNYLIKRIEDIKYKNKKETSDPLYSKINKITFKSIYDIMLSEEDYKLSNKSLYQKKSRIQAQIRNILKKYRTNDFIENYKINNESIEIIL